MEYKLPQILIDSLVEQGETGMGFQHVVLQMKDGNRYQGLVFNCENLQTNYPLNVDEIVSATVIPR